MGARLQRARPRAGPGPEPGQAQGGTEWTNKMVILSIVSPFVDFRFEYTSGTSFTGDLAIDDIMLN